MLRLIRRDWSLLPRVHDGMRPTAVATFDVKHNIGFIATRLGLIRGIKRALSCTLLSTAIITLRRMLVQDTIHLRPLVQDTIHLRPLVFGDIELLYNWATDITIQVYAGWSRPLSLAAFTEKHTRRITQPSEELILFGVEYEQRLVGHVQLALIDHVERRAAVGVVIGDKSVWGKGVGGAALTMLLDYAFTVQNLERIYAEAYGFNTRSHRLLERVGFQREGVLRQHEMHNGSRQDMHIFGILKHEFYQQHQTRFPTGT